MVNVSVVRATGIESTGDLLVNGAFAICLILITPIQTTQSGSFIFDQARHQDGQLNCRWFLVNSAGQK